MTRHETRIGGDAPPAQVERTPPPLDSRLALRTWEAAEVLGISEAMLRKLLPTLPHVRLGRAVVLPVDLLREWLRERARVERSRADTLAEEILGDLRDDG